MHHSSSCVIILRPVLLGRVIGSSHLCMVSFPLVSAGQRHAVKLTPMQQLSQIVDSVGQKIDRKLDVAACKLLYNTKQIDLTLPVRFANIPSGSTLELQSGAAQ